MSGPVTIALAGEQHLVRQGIRRLLEDEPSFKVVAEIDDGLRVTDEVIRLRPAVLVLDLFLPGLGGMEVTRQVARRAPATRIVMLSGSAREIHAIQALRNGASGYVRTNATAEDLLRAIHEVRNGNHFVSPPFPEDATEAFRRRALENSDDPYELLTAREREVFRLAAEGLGNVEIAPQLGISPRTVETHRARIMRKLGFKRPADVVREAIRRGMLPPDGPWEPGGDAD